MCDFKGDTPSCKCRMAVLKAYNEMREGHEQPETFAMEAACIVYHHHHPEDPKDLARLKVERWVHAGHLH